MPAIRLVDMAGKNSANIWWCAAVASSLRLHIIPCMSSQLADLSLVIVRVKIKMARRSHNVDACLSGVLLGLKVNTSSKCVDLLGLQIDLLTDQIGVSGGIR